MKCAACLRVDSKSNPDSGLLAQLARDPHMAMMTSHPFSASEIAAKRRELGLPDHDNDNNGNDDDGEGEEILLEQRPTGLRLELQPELVQRPQKLQLNKPATKEKRVLTESTLKAPEKCPAGPGGEHVWGDGICQACGFNSSPFVQEPSFDGPVEQHLQQ